MTPSRARLPLLLASPLPALLVGACVATRAGAPLSAFAPNLVAALLGAGLAAAVAPRAGSLEALSRRAIAGGGLALAALAATFAFGDLQGVHRWMSLGPMRLNASAALAPWLLAAAWAFLERGRRGVARVAALAVAVAALHAAQPDAGQQTAIVAGLVVLLLVHPAARRLPGWALGLTALPALAVTWSRPDPLAPVAHVEEVLVLGLSSGPAWAAATVGSALVLLALPAWAALRAWSDAAAPGATLVTALVVYLTATLLVPLAGAFPVPVMGAGAGPVLGWYAALGLVAALPPSSGAARTR